ncbi:MAG: hypothetical protein ABIH21_02030 [Patescibacteria group bacterium]
MSKTPNYDKKIKTILDATIPGERVCELTGQKFELTQEHIDWAKELNVPPTQWKPEVRNKYLAGFANGIAMWKNKHAETGKELFSYVHPDSVVPVVTDKEWHEREYIQNEKELDPQEPFFEQFEWLLMKSPIGAMLDEGSNKGCFGVELIESTNCYLTFHALKGLRVYESMNAMNCQDCINVINSYHLTDTAYVNHCLRLHGCIYAFECYESSNSSFIFDCRNCESCFGSTNKRNKKYLWWNEQLSEQEWKKRRAEVDLGSLTQFEKNKNRFYQMMQEQAVWPENFSVRSNDCSGDYLTDCVDLKKGFSEKGTKHCFWTMFGQENEHTYFNMWTGFATNVYSSNGSKNSNRTICCHYCKYCQNMEYSFLCFNCEVCFGCINLKRKKFCIFNKQYSEDGYWQCVDEIKCAMLDRGEYGKFFPAKYSPMGHEYAFGELFEGHTNQELESFGAPRYDTSVGEIVNEDEVSAIKADELPDNINDVDDKFIGKPIYDAQAKRLFSFVAPEIDLMKRLHVPPHREHVFSRLRFITQHSNLMTTEQGVCAKCNKEIQLNKNNVFENRKVYCIEDYLKLIEQNG